MYSLARTASRVGRKAVTILTNVDNHYSDGRAFHSIKLCNRSTRTMRGWGSIWRPLALQLQSPYGCSQSIATVSSSSIEGNVVRLLQSEIEYELESNPPDQIPDGEIPDDEIPFIVKDMPGEQWIVLHRKYGKENIKIEATMLDLGPGDSVEDLGEDDIPCKICLAVTISKDEATKSMMLGCSAYPDEITVDRVAIMEAEPSYQLTYEGPGFERMKENLQGAFQEFLQERGIDDNLSNYLYEYMINKSKKEYLNWLQRLQFFVENR